MEIREAVEEAKESNVLNEIKSKVFFILNSNDPVHFLYNYIVVNL